MQIQPDLCSACGQCADTCPIEAINPTPNYGPYRIGPACVNCGNCVEVCPQGAIVEGE